MEALMRYDPLKDHGFKEKQDYKIQMGLTEDNRINIQIDFPYPNTAKGLSKDSSVNMLALSFTTDEAEKLSAALNTMLHHPVDKGKPIEWENK